ncbi:MAG: hypothetical protein AAF191_03800, partial [Verrucomicrobiota bacterium]
MNPKPSRELDGLIHACLDDALTAEEAERLNQMLLESSEARAQYWELALIHGQLEQSLQQASVQVLTGGLSAPSRKWR